MKLSYANVMSTIAVFGVLGGGAYAAGTIGSNDIKPDAIHSSHVKDGEIARRDLDTSDVAKSFGSDVYFGKLTNFGPVADGMGSSVLTPFMGQEDAGNPEADRGGGPNVLLPPIDLRARDLLLHASFPV
jgi:hypothetical protein